MTKMTHVHVDFFCLRIYLYIVLYNNPILTIISFFIGESTSSIIYGHDGRRVASNWKGSASYFHIRDAVPVYYWPDNHGAYTIYATAKHFIERNFFPIKYFKDIATGTTYFIF